MLTDFFKKQLRSVTIIKRPSSGWTASASDISVGTINGIVTAIGETLAPNMDTTVALQESIAVHFSARDFKPDGDATLTDITIGDIIIFNGSRYEISMVDFRDILNH